MFTGSLRMNPLKTDYPGKLYVDSAKAWIRGVSITAHDGILDAFNDFSTREDINNLDTTLIVFE